jgi:putative hemolysin
MKTHAWLENLASLGKSGKSAERHGRAQTASSPGYTISFAAHQDEIAEAQRLRYKVFAEEMGAKLASAPADPLAPGYDVDEFDLHCEHLLVRSVSDGKVVGAYRLLPPESARRVGRLYSESEFDLTRLDHLRRDVVEAGRSCVHWDHRNGAVIMLLWAGIARYMKRYGYGYLIGCASISLRDGGHGAANLYASLEAADFVVPEYRVFPRLPLPHERLRNGEAAVVPPLIKGYLRAGAKVGGAPAWDPDFNTADLFMFLPMQALDPRYARHFG